MFETDDCVFFISMVQCCALFPDWGLATKTRTRTEGSEGRLTASPMAFQYLRERRQVRPAHGGGTAVLRPFSDGTAVF